MSDSKPWHEEAREWLGRPVKPSRDAVYIIRAALAERDALSAELAAVKAERDATYRTLGEVSESFNVQLSAAKAECEQLRNDAVVVRDGHWEETLAELDQAQRTIERLRADLHNPCANCATYAGAKADLCWAVDENSKLRATIARLRAGLDFVGHMAHMEVPHKEIQQHAHRVLESNLTEQGSDGEGQR